MTVHDREQHLFIVRIWRERSARIAGWRGSAKHVESGTAIVSADIDELTDFIRVRLVPDSDGSATGEGQSH